MNILEHPEILYHPGISIMVDSNEILTKDIDRIYEVVADTKNTSVSFEFNCTTAILLKNKTIIHTSLSAEDVYTLINKASTEFIEGRPKVSASDSSKSGRTDSIEDLLEQLVKQGEDQLKVTKALTEHIHTISEMFTRLTLHITEGSPITIRKNFHG